MSINNAAKIPIDLNIFPHIYLWFLYNLFRICLSLLIRISIFIEFCCAFNLFFIHRSWYLKLVFIGLAIEWPSPYKHPFILFWSLIFHSQQVFIFWYFSWLFIICTWELIQNKFITRHKELILFLESFLFIITIHLLFNDKVFFEL